MKVRANKERLDVWSHTSTTSSQLGKKYRLSTSDRQIPSNQHYMSACEYTQGSKSMQKKKRKQDRAQQT